MNLFSELEKEIKNIKREFDETKKQDIKNATKIIKNENKDIYYNIKTLYNDNKNNPDELIARIIVTFNLAINKTYEIVDKLLESSAKTIIHLCKNNEVSDSDLKELEKIYNSKIEELNNLNEKFVKTMYHNYDLYIKGKDSELVLIIKEGELKLITSLSDILDKKHQIKRLFKYNIIPFVKYIKESKKYERDNNKQKITDYFINLYNEYIESSLNEYKILIDDYIVNELDNLDNKIKKLNKKNKSKDILKLKNYLLEFNKELFIRNKDILLEMSNVLKEDDKEKEFKIMSKKLDRVYNISYKFDKVFNDYKESNTQSILINNKSFDGINKLVKNEEEEMERYFSNKVMSLFKETEEYLNTLVYKIILTYYTSLDGVLK